MPLSFPVPKIGLGAAPLGATHAGSFSVDSETQAIQTVHHCLQRGIHFFDTAPFYGAGLSELRLGKALATSGIARNQYVLESKIGVLVNADGSMAYSFTREATQRCIDESLRRLQTDYLDMALIHDADTNFADVFDQAYPVLADLKAQGVIRAIGAGMNHWQHQSEFAQRANFDCFLLAGRYTLLEQGPLKEFFPLCQDKGIDIFLGGVFNSGILATGAIPGALYQYAPAPPQLIEKTQRIETVCAKHGVALKAAALQFAAAHPVVRSLVVGMVSPQEIDDNLAALAAILPAVFWEDLKLQGLIDANAPVG